MLPSRESPAGDRFVQLLRLNRVSLFYLSHAAELDEDPRQSLTRLLARGAALLLHLPLSESFQCLGERGPTISMSEFTLAHLLMHEGGKPKAGGAPAQTLHTMNLAPSIAGAPVKKQPPVHHHHQVPTHSHAIPAHPVPPPHIGYGPMDVDLSLSDEVCVELQASACTVVEDVCGLVEGARASKGGAYCQGLRSYCAREAASAHTPAFTVDAKMCVRFEASTDACAIVTEACQKGSGNEHSTFCSKAVSLCTAQF